MQTLQEITFNSADKQVSINQADYRRDKARLLKDRLPISIAVAKNGQSVELQIAVARENSSITIHLIDPTDDVVAGRLYLAKPDIFPGAYYVTSMALSPEYQQMGIGGKLYNALIEHFDISLIGIDQSEGARKMWLRLAKIPDNVLYAVMVTQQNGYFYFKCVANGASNYAYINYEGRLKPIQHQSNFFVILARRGGKMDFFVTQHIKLASMRANLSRIRAHVDPFGAHISQD